MVKSRTLILCFSLVFASVILLLQPCLVANDYMHTYYLKADESKYRLSVTVSQSLYNTYQGKSHMVSKFSLSSDYQRFVTPKAVAPVASQIRSILTDNEDFANAVLMMTHQIVYQAGGVKYPVETIVDDVGDCDSFSLLAASLMKAAGLEVILLVYPDHMNLGVYLPHEPRNARNDISWYPYNNKNYYVAETTGQDWENGNRVGEDPTDYGKAQIIPLENYETTSPGQVTATLTKLDSSYTLIIGHDFLYALSAIVVVVGASYAFLRLRRGKRTEQVRPVGVSATSSISSEVLKNWNVKMICPKCGAWISTDKIEYCICGEKLKPPR